MMYEYMELPDKTAEVIAKPSRLRLGQARPFRRSVSLCGFAKMRKGRACRGRGLASASTYRDAQGRLLGTRKRKTK